MGAGTNGGGLHATTGIHSRPILRIECHCHSSLHPNGGNGSAAGINATPTATDDDGSAAVLPTEQQPIRKFIRYRQPTALWLGHASSTIKRTQWFHLKVERKYSSVTKGERANLFRQVWQLYIIILYFRTCVAKALVSVVGEVK